MLDDELLVSLRTVYRMQRSVLSDLNNPAVSHSKPTTMQRKFGKFLFSQHHHECLMVSFERMLYRR